MIVLLAHQERPPSTLCPHISSQFLWAILYRFTTSVGLQSAHWFGAWGWELCSPKKSSLICLPVQTQPPPPNSYYCWYVTCHSTQYVQQPHMACTPIIIHENHAPSTCLFGKQVLADWDIKNETRSSLLLLLFISHMHWWLSHSYIIFFFKLIILE